MVDSTVQAGGAPCLIGPPEAQRSIDGSTSRRSSWLGSGSADTALRT